MNWKLLLIALTCAIVGISARPADETKPIEITQPPTTATAAATTKEEKPTTTTKTTTEASQPMTTISSKKIENEKLEEKQRDFKDSTENRELKVASTLQVTSEDSKKDSKIPNNFHKGEAVPLSLEEYEKELEREKELLNKAKKKIAMESSTPKDGISTWILLSGSHVQTTSKPEQKPASYRIDDLKQAIAPKVNVTTTTKKRPTTTTRMPKPTQKFNNKVLAKVKVEPKNEPILLEEVTTKVPTTTKKVPITTTKKIVKKYSTTRKPTTLKTTTPPVTIPVEVIDDETEEHSHPPPVETSTFLIMEPKDADFDLPSDREPLKPVPTKKAKIDVTPASGTTKKKKKTTTSVATSATTKIKKKIDKKTDIKLKNKPEKPITTQIYNYLAREVMPTVGVGLVGLVVTAGLATYFLGGPLTALRRSYDIASRRDDVVYDRSDDFGNIQNEEEMFGKVIAGMPESSPYRNNLRVNSYRPKSTPPSASPYYGQQYSKYGGNQPSQQLRYRTIDPYQNSYQFMNSPYYIQSQQGASQPAAPLVPAQNIQPKTARIDYNIEAAAPQSSSQNTETQSTSQQQPASTSKFNIDSVDMTTNEPVDQSYNIEYDDLAPNFYQTQDELTSHAEVESVEKQKMYEVEPEKDTQRSEKVTIIQAQSVPSNHRVEQQQQQQQQQQISTEETNSPKTAALTMSNSEEEYQNSIANAIFNQKKQFVVGSVIADNFEDSPESYVPEHGPRRRRNAVRKSGKSLDDNEIERDDDNVVVLKRENESVVESSTTLKVDETTEQLKEEAAHVSEVEGSTTQQTTQTPTISTTTRRPYFSIDPQNNIFSLLRRIVDMKLRLGINFLQNATSVFQEYLKGVEERVNKSPLFNSYATMMNKVDGTTTTTTKRPETVR